MDGISSTKPYLIRALHEWCSDNGVTPYIVVSVDQTVDVPKESVRNGEIVLNVSLDATNGLLLGNDYISFRARFGGIPREVVVPVIRVTAIYSRESGAGMSFPVERITTANSPEDAVDKLLGEPKKATSLVGIEGGARSVEASQPPFSSLSEDKAVTNSAVEGTSVVRAALTRIK
jgi:stringent starvation protein B